MLQTFLTPKDAAPETGLSTAGKPTCVPACSTSPSERMRAFRGVGKPAAFRAARVACLFRALSTASGLWPGRPRASLSRATRGTESSTKVAMPSTGPVIPSWPRSWMAANASLKTLSEDWDMSTGMNLAMMPSSMRHRLHESGCSMMTTLIPSAAARSMVNLFPWSPADMNTIVAPRASFLRSCCACSLACVKRSCGTRAII
mmetsp:Transcript_106784/g.300173  ORF Transcript_106784/g.300173 Transcript_106784/m.300173 type:complete len:202 (+) Transcript_106784:914-1519(+)